MSSLFVSVSKILTRIIFSFIEKYKDVSEQLAAFEAENQRLQDELLRLHEDNTRRMQSEMQTESDSESPVIGCTYDIFVVSQCNDQQFFLVP